MSKVLFWFFIISLILCVLVNVIAFFAEKANKKHFADIAKKDENE